jgi:PAS domain S-box-containing protein
MYRVILCLFIFCNFLFAFEPLQISSNNKIQGLSQPLYLSGEENFEKAYEKLKKGEFKQLNDEIKSFGFFDTPFWISLEILNNDDEDLFLSFVDISIEKATLYKYHNDILIETKQSGLLTPRENNNLENLVPKFYLEKSPISYTYLIKIDSSLPSLVEILIGNNSEIINSLIPEIAIFLILLGSFLSLFFYNIFLYFSTKEKDYLLYSIYILFLVSWMNSFHGYFTAIFGFSLEIKNIIEVFTLLGSTLFLLLFSFKFLDIQNRDLKKWCYIFLVIAGIYFIRTSFSYFTSMIILICVSSFCLYLGIQKFIEGYSSSKYYIFALGGYLIGIIVSFSMFNGFLEANFYTLQAQLIGTIWGMIFLSLALGYKLSLIQIERNNAILKAQVQEKMLFLQSRQASVGELVGNIAHQWREPLAEIGAIQTNLQATLLIKGVATKEKILDSLEQSSGIIRHLSDTIDVFYRFFKHEKSNKNEFNLITVMHDVRKMVHYILEVENISFLFEHDDEIYIFGDRNEFANAIINIILNAKDVLVDRKTINPYIKIKIEEVDNMVIINIEDNAGGIKQEPIEKIFESCISSKSENIGIGLYIVKTIIEKRLRGKIDVKNGEFGAIFTIWIPLNSETKEVEFFQTALNMEETTLDRIYRLERKVEKQVELEKTLRQWEEIFKQTHWAVSVHNGKNNQFEMVNPAFYEMYGYSQKELEYMKIENLFSPSSLNILYVKQKEAFEKCFSSFEAIHLRKDGYPFPVNIDLTVIKNENGDILYHIANIRDISEQKEIEDALKTSEEAFRAMVENSPDVIMRYDLNCRRTYINPLGLILMGKPQDELLGKTPQEFSPLPDIKEFEQAFYRVINEAKEMKIEGVFYTPWGEKRWGEERIIPELNSKGEVASVLVIGRDMTEQKRANERLLLKKFALDHISEALYLMNEEGKFCYVNKGACRALGYSEAELLKLNIGDVDADWPIERWPEHWNIIKEIKTMTMELRHKRKDGTIFPVEVLANYFEYEGIAYNMGLARDISDRKIAEENLLLKEFALNKINESVFLIDENSKFHYVNEATCKNLGYTQEELLKMSVPDVDSYVSIEWWNEHWNDIKLNNTLTLTEHKRKDGTTFPIEISSNYFEYNGIGYSLAVSRDISERLMIQKRKDEEKMRLFFDHQLVGMAITSPTKGWLHVNDKLCEMLGFSSTELKNMTWEQITHPDDLSIDINNFDSMLSGKIDFYTIEKRYICKDKSIIYTNLSIGCVRKEDGSVDYVLALIEDITKRKEIEKKLADSHDFLNNLIDSIPDPIFVKDRKHKWIILNKANCQFAGLAKEYLIGKSDYDIFPKEEADIFWEKDELVFNSNEVNINEEYFTSKDGITHCIETVKSMFVSNDGKEYLVGIIRDISERKAVQKRVELLNEELEEKVIERTAKLAKKEREFRTLAENIPNFLSRYDKDGNRIYVNPTLCNYFGVSSQEILGTNPQEYPLSGVPIELYEKITHVLQTGFKTNMEIVDFKDGEKRWWTLILAPEFDENGNVEGVVSIGHDITYIKQSEEQLQLLKTAINNTNDAFYIIDDNRNICYVSDASCKMLGYSHDEFLNMKVEDIDSYLKVEEIDEIKEKVFKFNTTTFQTNHRTKDNKILDVEITVTNFIYNHTNLRLSIVKDITQLKKHEATIDELNKNLEQKVIKRTEELQKALEFNKSIIQAIPDMLFEVSKEGIYLNVWARDEKFLAVQKEILLGKNFRDILPSDAIEVSLKTMKEVDMYGSSLGNIYKLDFPDGEQWFELHSTIKEPDGTYLALARNITERKKAQNELIELNLTLEEKVKERTFALQKALEWSEDIINTLPDILFEMDKDGNYLGVWTQNKELLAQQKEMLIGNNIYNVLSKEASDIITSAFKEINTDKYISRKKISINLPQGTKDFELSISKKSDGNFLLLSRDISERS